MANEFSIENLFFYQVAESFQNSDLDDRKREQWAKQIYLEFIKDGGIQEINISFKTKADIKKCIDDNTVTRDLFNEAKAEIFTLMERDSVPRFVSAMNYRNSIDLHPDGQERLELQTI